MMEKIIAAILFRINGRRLFWMQIYAYLYAKKNTPSLLKAYKEIKKLGASGSSHQPNKGYHLWKLLLKFKPRKIIELGSGTTSAVFKIYAREYGASYVAFEHSEHWGEITNSSLRSSNLLEDNEEPPVLIKESYILPDGTGSAFTEPVPADSDFIYIDGPPCPVIDGVKKPNFDIAQHFDRGNLPKVIVVDGRHETVDLIRNHPKSHHYHFEFDFVYSIRMKDFLHALHFYRHTVIWLKNE
ncbi:MAG TPA: hypothetical protein DDZ83_02765, partial [Nitrospinae bacterium]|nr:hypothetical protein [Nitrospinota bacterium]